MVWCSWLCAQHVVSQAPWYFSVPSETRLYCCGCFASQPNRHGITAKCQTKSHVDWCLIVWIMHMCTFLLISVSTNMKKNVRCALSCGGWKLKEYTYNEIISFPMLHYHCFLFYLCKLHKIWTNKQNKTTAKNKKKEKKRRASKKGGVTHTHMAPPPLTNTRHKHTHAHACTSVMQTERERRASS